MKGIDEFNDSLPNVTIEYIPIKELVSNQEYQRNLSMDHVNKAVESFDPYQLNPVKVSRRNGINYVFNGQHTIEIVANKSGSRETSVLAMVYDDLEYEYEAQIFANQQKHVKPLTPYEIFIANIEAGNDMQILIKSIVEKYNMTISGKKGIGKICAISTMESIFQKYGYQVLDKVIRLAIATWEGDVDAFSAIMLKALSFIVVAYDSELKEKLFKERMGLYSMKEIMKNGRDRNNGSFGYAEAMVILYNKRMKVGNLPIYKLHMLDSRMRKFMVNNYQQYQEEFDEIPEDNNNEDFQNRYETENYL